MIEQTQPSALSKRPLTMHQALQSRDIDALTAGVIDTLNGLIDPEAADMVSPVVANAVRRALRIASGYVLHSATNTLNQLSRQEAKELGSVDAFSFIPDNSRSVLVKLPTGSWAIATYNPKNKVWYSIYIASTKGVVERLDSGELEEVTLWCELPD